jgi:hypothetical protein
MAADPTTPQARYGRPGLSRRARYGGGIALLAVFAGAVGWLGWRYGNTPAQVRVIGYVSTPDQRVQVRLSGTKTADSTVSCLVKAADSYHEEVGRYELRVGPGTSKIDTVVGFGTHGRAVSAEVTDCAVQATGTSR